MREKGPVIVALLATTVLAGCGTNGGSDSTATLTGPTVSGKPIGPPAPKESIKEAVTRIGDTASSQDCTAVNKLTTLSRPYDACAGIQALVKLPVAAAAAYGRGGGVIDYISGETVRNTILILDSDGLYHVPLVDPYNIQQSVGTPFADQFDGAAEDAVSALRDGDCDAFKKAALSRLGPGSTPGRVCTYVQQAPLAQLLNAYPDAEAKRLGGNADYAFYGISTPQAFVTMVLAREAASGVATGAPALPSGAPEYGYVDAYQTNPTTTPPAPSG